MDSTATFFLAVIALSSLVQAVFLVGLAVYGLKLKRRLESVQVQIDREIKPSLDRLARATENIAEISEMARREARHIDAVVRDTVSKVQRTTDEVRDLVAQPLGMLGNIAAFVKGIQRGVEVYNRLRGFEPDRRGRAGRYEDDDEHLFI